MRFSSFHTGITTEMSGMLFIKRVHECGEAFGELLACMVFARVLPSAHGARMQLLCRFFGKRTHGLGDSINRHFIKSESEVASDDPRLAADNRNQSGMHGHHDARRMPFRSRNKYDPQGLAVQFFE